MDYTVQHKVQVGTNNHVVYSLTYTNALTRQNAVGLVATDIGKVARQLDTDTFWVLTGISPVVAWTQVGGGAPAQEVHVGKSGCEFASVRLAVNFAASHASATTPYVVFIHPGTYIENPFTIPANVKVEGSGWSNTILKTTNLSTHFITLQPMGLLNGVNLHGPTAFGQSCVHHAPVNDPRPALIGLVSISQGYYGIYTHPSVSSGTLLMDTILFGYAGFNVQSLIRAEGLVALTAVQFVAAGGPPNSLVEAFSFDGPGVDAALWNCQHIIPNGDGVFVDNGAVCRIFSSRFALGKNAIHIGPGGASKVRVTGTQIQQLSGGYTWAFKIDSAAALVSFEGTMDRLKIDNAVGANMTALFNDVNVGSGGSMTLGELRLGYTTTQFVPLLDYASETFLTGLTSGGAVTRNAGRVLSVAAGEGYINDGVVPHKIVWGATTVTIGANSTEYVYVDNTEVVRHSPVQPDYNLNVVLAQAISDATTIDFLTQDEIGICYVAGHLAEYLEDVIGPMSLSGAATAVFSVPLRQVIVGSGEFCIGLSRRVVAGSGGAAVFYFWHHNGAGVWVADAGQTQINNTQIDTGTGLIPFVGWKKDALYVAVSAGLTEFHVICGQQVFANQPDAEAGSLPVPPSPILHYAMGSAGIVLQNAGSIASLMDIRPRLGQFSSIGGAIGDHSLLANLANDDHLQYLTTARALIWHNGLSGAHVTNGNTHDHTGGAGAQIDHTDLANHGVYTHAQLDGHILDTANPHNVTKAQVGLTNVTDDRQIRYVDFPLSSVDDQVALFDGLTGKLLKAGSLTAAVVKSAAGILSAASAGTDFVAPNAAIVAATKTKISYDTKGLVTAGADATAADVGAPALVSPSVIGNVVTFSGITGAQQDSGVAGSDVSSAISLKHSRSHGLTSTSDHTSSATSGQMLKANVNGLPVDASNTDAEVSAAVSTSHAKSHGITSTVDHTSSATSGQMLKADANGLPVNATNTDAQVSAAISASHSPVTLGAGNHPALELASGQVLKLNLPHLDLTEEAIPSTPAANVLRLYVEDFNGFSLFSFKDDTGMVRKLVRDSVFVGKNTTVVTIPVGTAVYASGSSGNVPTFAVTDPTNAAKMPCIGITVEVITAGSFGRAMQVGLLENLNTNAFNEGDVLYCDPAVSGGLTNVRPAFPNIVQQMGTVLVKSATIGKIQIIARSAGVGDMFGPSSAVTGNIVSFNGTTGKLVADSLITAASVSAAVGASHARSHAMTSTSDHTSSATSGQMLKANANGLPVDATNTDAQVSAAVSASHAKSHAITSSTDHTSSATSGQMLKADANGLPVNATNTDAQVSGAVSASHARSHAITSSSDHTSSATSGQLLKANANGLPVDATNTDAQVSGHLSSTANPHSTTASQVGLSAVTNDAQIKASDFPAASIDSEVALFSSTTGKVLKRATLTASVVKSTAGILSAATAGVDYVAPVTETGEMVLRPEQGFNSAGTKASQTTYEGASFEVRKPITFNRISMRATAVASAGDFVVGIYQASGGGSGVASLKASALLNITGTGLNTLTVIEGDVTLEAGLCYVLFGKRSGTITVSVFTAMTASMLNDITYLGSVLHPTTFTTAISTAAFPATFNPLPTVGAAVPATTDVILQFRLRKA